LRTDFAIVRSGTELNENRKETAGLNPERSDGAFGFSFPSRRADGVRSEEIACWKDKRPYEPARHAGRALKFLPGSRMRRLNGALDCRESKSAPAEQRQQRQKEALK
jgi:hypothetical protein